MDFVENISKGFWFCFNPSFSCYPLNLLLTFFEEHVAIETLKLNRHSWLIFYVTVLLMPNLKTQLAIIAIRALKLSKTFSEPAKSAVQRNTPILCISHLNISSSAASLFSCLQPFEGIRVFSNKSALGFRWPKYWNFSFSISPSNEYSELISFRIDWFDLLAERICACMLNHFSGVQLFEPLQTVACLVPPSMKFSRQEYWSGLPCPPPGDLPDSETEPASPALQADSLLLSHWGSPQNESNGSQMPSVEVEWKETGSLPDSQ